MQDLQTLNSQIPVISEEVVMLLSNLTYLKSLSESFGTLRTKPA